MREKTSTGKQTARKPRLKLPYKLLFLLCAMVIEAASVGWITPVVMAKDYTKDPLALIVAVALILAIVVQAYYAHRLVVDVLRAERELKNCVPLIDCHRDPENSFYLLGKQFIVCARCTGFYVGIILFALLSIIHRSVWLEFLSYIGFYVYILISILSVLSVPIHGMMTRTYGIKRQRFLRFLIGVFFSSSVFLIGNLILVLFLK